MRWQYLPALAVFVVYFSFIGLGVSAGVNDNLPKEQSVASNPTIPQSIDEKCEQIRSVDIDDRAEDALLLKKLKGVRGNGKTKEMTGPDDQERAKPRPVKVKGLYVTGFNAGSWEKLQPILQLVEETEINALVIDVKDVTGFLTYDSRLGQVQALGADSDKIKDMKELVRQLRQRDIYLIARLVLFKDPLLAKKRIDLAVQKKNGKLWLDYKGKAWADPYSKEVWDYNLSIASEAAKFGFDEVQFDYVRFPSDGPVKEAVYPGRNQWSKEETIKQFLAYARKTLEPYGIYISADVFGLVTSARDDMGIGQKLELVAQEVDYISPMVYPSHYAPGTYGLQDPNAMPYDTVYKSLTDAVYRLEGMETTLRPWLQDFTLGYRYGPREVRQQIQATYDAGLEEWILWNPANTYTKEALLETNN